MRITTRLAAVGAAVAALLAGVTTPAHAATITPNDRFTLGFYDPFTTQPQSHPSWWYLYRGHPGSDPGASWDPSHVAAKDGTLRVRTNKNDRLDWVSGGLNTSPRWSATAGAAEVRMQRDIAPKVTSVFLLWPTAGGWPPEIDVVEDRRGTSTPFVSIHDGTRTAHYNKTYLYPKIDMRQWHTYRVEWGPSAAGGRVMRFYIDRKPWLTLRAHVPVAPMCIAVQANVVTGKTGARPAPDAVKAYSETRVDWVRGWTLRKGQTLAY